MQVKTAIGKQLGAILLLVLGIGLRVEAQQRCATPSPAYLGAKIPALRAYEAQRAAEWQAQTLRPPGGLRVIPTVVHLIQYTPAEAISDDRVQSQIDVLNEDFRKLNADTNLIPLEFRSVAADCQIEFRLAKIDPNGCPTTGINRVVAPHLAYHGLADEQALKSYVQWDPYRYLNIWVPVNLGDNLLGYATFPTWLSWDPGSDGVVVNGNNFGRGFGTPASTYNKGRTATHEVGHWLGLYHTFDGGCAGTTASNCLSQGDEVCDTPPTQGANYGCPGSPANSCTETPTDLNDQTMNYMDYVDDACMYMFTYGQQTRMQFFLDNERQQIWSPANLAATGTDGGSVSPGCMPVAAFSLDRPVVCVGDSVHFSDESFGPATSWQWTFSGGSPATDTNAQAATVWSTPGTYTVTLVATNGIGTDAEVKTDIVTVLPANGGPIAEDFETLSSLPTNWYTQDEDMQGSWNIMPSASNGTGSQSLRVLNFSGTAPHSRDDLITPLIDLSGNAGRWLTFAHAYKRRGSFVIDSLEVHVSTDCGATWNRAWQRSGAMLATTGGYATTAPFVPTPSQWRLDSVDLLSFAGQQIRLMFRLIGGNSQNIYLDDINLPMVTEAANGTTEQFECTAFPNPSSDCPSIQLFTSSPGKMCWSLHDLQGRLLGRSEPQLLTRGQHSFALEPQLWGKLPNGMYLLEVNQGNRSQTIKIVKSGHR